jgi:hypothetical protein
MGYSELARTGFLGHQAHIGVSVPEFNPLDHPIDTPPLTTAEAMSKSYWEKQENQEQWRNAWHVSTNPNGYWLAYGHLFKVLYSYNRLIGRIDDKEKVSLCSQILLERCVNPRVQGG